MARKKAPVTLAEHLSSIAASGGKARAEKLSAKKRKEISLSGASAGGKARAEAMTKKQRSEAARRAVAARWAKARGEEA